jgi:hypothetical protein
MTDDEIVSMVTAFEDCTLPRERWTHSAHLTVALYYLRTRDRQAATSAIRDGIQRYNLSLGNQTGYHETITLSWIAVISHYLEAIPPATPLAEAVEGLLDRCGRSDYLSRYYSRDWLMSDAARVGWVEPDLRPIR